MKSKRPRNIGYSKLKSSEAIPLTSIPTNDAFEAALQPNSTTAGQEKKGDSDTSLTSIRIDPLSSVPAATTHAHRTHPATEYRSIPITPISALLEMKSTQKLILSNTTLFTNYIGRKAAKSKITNEDSIALVTKNYPPLEKDLKEELSYMIHKYQREFRDQPQQELEEILRYNIEKEHTLKLFYEQVGRPMKYYGFKLEATPTNGENRLYNYKTYHTIREDLELINNEGYGARLFQSFTSILSFTLIYNIISGALDLSDSPKYSKYATIIPQAAVFLLAIILTILREKYLTRTIRKISDKIQESMVTSEAYSFDLSDLRVALLHAISIRIAVENVLKEQSTQEANAANKHSSKFFSTRQSRRKPVFNNKLALTNNIAEEKSSSEPEPDSPKSPSKLAQQ